MKRRVASFLSRFWRGKHSPLQEFNALPSSLNASASAFPFPLSILFVMQDYRILFVCAISGLVHSAPGHNRQAEGLSEALERPPHSLLHSCPFPSLLAQSLLRDQNYIRCRPLKNVNICLLNSPPPSFFVSATYSRLDPIFTSYQDIVLSTKCLIQLRTRMPESTIRPLPA